MKKRKHRVGLIIALVSIGVLIVAPVAAVFICFYNKDNTTIESKEVEISTYANDLLHDALNPTAETGTIDFTFSQEVLNGFVSKINSSIPDQAKNFVDRFYITMDSDYYRLVGNFHAYFFPTTAELKLKFSKVKEAESPRDWYIQFDIIDVTVGRIHGLKNVLLWAAGKFNLKDSINDALKNSPLSLEADLDNARVVYTYGNFLNDVKKMISGESYSNELYFQTMEEFVDNGMLDFDFETKGQMSLICDVASFGKQEGEDHRQSPEVRDVANMVAERINTVYRANPDLETENVIKLFHYFFHGYDRINDSDKEAIDTIDLSCLDTESLPWDKEGYKGFEDLRNGKKLEDVILEQTPGLPGTLTVEMLMEFVADPVTFAFSHPELYTEIMSYGEAEHQKLTEWQALLAKIDTGEEILHLKAENIDDFVKSRNDFLGYAQLSYAGETKDESGKRDDFDVNYVALDDFYTVLSEGTADLNLGMSLNGYEAVIGLHTVQAETTSEYQISLDIDDLTIGTNVIKSQLGTSLMKILSTAVAGNNTFSLTVDEENPDRIGNVTFDFESSIRDDIKAVLIAKNRKIDIKLVKDEDDVGYFSIKTAPRIP